MDTGSHSRGDTRPRFARNFLTLRTEGAGNAGRSMRPQPRVQQKSTRVSHHGHTGSPGIPRAMVLTVSFVLSPVIGLSCHRRLRFVSANLTPASRRQDHTTSPSARCSVRQRCPASTAFRPAALTIACRPSSGTEHASYNPKLRFGQA